ncbi:MAG: GNAT family N-acetyltransferase [Ferruginibacter sp.]|nr:GNAT family N-acetyltransferase [Cytophagales bacterium]
MQRTESGTDSGATDETIRCREAGAADIPAILAVAEATWRPTYLSIVPEEQVDYMYAAIYNPASLRQQIEDWHHTFLLLWLNNTPVGFASFSPRTEEPTVFKLHKLYLVPGRQGQGLGKRLIEAVSDRVRKAGGHHLDLNVNRNNPARFFYERNGFRILGEEDVPIGPYWMNDYVMRKEVAGSTK